MPVLEAVGRHLEPGGHLLVNVPALQPLFSAYDVAAGHFRRYDRPSLARGAGRSGTGSSSTCATGASRRSRCSACARCSCGRRPTETIRRGFGPPSRFAHAEPARADEGGDGRPGPAPGRRVAAHGRPAPERRVTRDGGRPAFLAVACVAHAAVVVLLFADVLFAGDCRTSATSRRYYYPELRLRGRCAARGRLAALEPDGRCRRAVPDGLPGRAAAAGGAGRAAHARCRPPLHVWLAMCGATALAARARMASARGLAGRAGSTACRAALLSSLNLFELSHGAAWRRWVRRRVPALPPAAERAPAALLGRARRAPAQHAGRRGRAPDGAGGARAHARAALPRGAWRALGAAAARGGAAGARRCVLGSARCSERDDRARGLRAERGRSSWSAHPLVLAETVLADPARRPAHDDGRRLLGTAVLSRRLSLPRQPVPRPAGRLALAACAGTARAAALGAASPIGVLIALGAHGPLRGACWRWCCRTSGRPSSSCSSRRSRCVCWPDTASTGPRRQDAPRRWLVCSACRPACCSRSVSALSAFRPERPALRPRRLVAAPGATGGGARPVGPLAGGARAHRALRRWRRRRCCAPTRGRALACACSDRSARHQRRGRTVDAARTSTTCSPRWPRSSRRAEPSAPDRWFSYGVESSSLAISLVAGICWRATATSGSTTWIARPLGPRRDASTAWTARSTRTGRAGRRPGRRSTMSHRRRPARYREATRACGAPACAGSSPSCRCPRIS